MLRTLRDATALSKADQAKPHWQTAAHVLIMAAELHQSIFCERASARRLLAASPRLLKLADAIARQLHALRQHHTGKLRLTDVKRLFQLMQDQS